MKFYSQRVIATVLVSMISIYGVWLWLFKSKAPISEEITVVENPVITTPVEAAQQIRFVLESKAESKPRQLRSIPINQHENFKDVKLTLKRLADFKKKKGIQEFQISKVRYDEREYAYAYWKQDNSIIILHFPFDGEPSESELYWLSGKARIDLKNDVVPTGKYENLGCCLVEKDWAEKVLSWCKSGYKLKFVAKKA